jgi:hypothetical protein
MHLILLPIVLACATPSTDAPTGRYQRVVVLSEGCLLGVVELLSRHCLLESALSALVWLVRGEHSLSSIRHVCGGHHQLILG